MQLCGSLRRRRGLWWDPLTLDRGVASSSSQEGFWGAFPHCVVGLPEWSHTGDSWERKQIPRIGSPKPRPTPQALQTSFPQFTLRLSRCEKRDAHPCGLLVCTSVCCQGQGSECPPEPRGLTRTCRSWGGGGRGGCSGLVMTSSLTPEVTLRGLVEGRTDWRFRKVPLEQGGGEQSWKLVQPWPMTSREPFKGL